VSRAKAKPEKVQLGNGTWITIEVKKAIVLNGARDIMIDGIVWGTAFPTSRGMHGYFYTFQDSAKRAVYQPLDGVQARHSHEWKVWSDKRAKRVEKDDRPIEVRLIQAVRSMIDAGLLKHPTIVNAEITKKREQFRAHQEQAAKDALTALKTKAEEVVDSWGGGLDDLKKRIVEAMQWAKTQ
jgi:hypothetical protein